MTQTAREKFRQAVIWLMMPGGDMKLVDKSANYAPDVIIPCLEDGVAYIDSEKKQAREDLAEFIRNGAHSARGIATFPRINHPSSIYWTEDVAAMVEAGADGIVVPKSETAEEIRAVDKALADAEKACGREVGSTALVVMMETAKGVSNADELAVAAERTVAFLFGREDFSASIGLMRRHADSLEQGSPELLFARSKVVLAAQAAGIGSIDGASFTFVDEDYMNKDASLTARIGYTGKLAAHPAHVASIRHGFTPLEEDLKVAADIVALEEAALAEGKAPIGGVAGMEVTPPIVEQARLLLARSEWSKQSNDRFSAAQAAKV
jgi:citrate lyase subunit beta / citryl-CoA lyase